MTQDERWAAKYSEVKGSIEREHRNPSSVTGNEKYSSIGKETAAKKVTSVQQNW